MQAVSHIVCPRPLNRARLAVAYGAIAGLYLFGLAASTAVPFGPPPSIVAVARRVVENGGSAGAVSWPLHGAVVAAAAILMAAYAVSRSRPVRIAIALVALFAPLAATPSDGLKGLAQWSFAMPAAPIYTIEALLGNGDGEFYAEGCLVHAAVGWWMLMACILLAGERSPAVNARRGAKVPRSEPRSEPRGA